MSIAEQRAVGFILAWSLATLQQVRSEEILENIQHAPDTKSDLDNILETESLLTILPQTSPQSLTLPNIPLVPSKPKPISPKDISSLINIQNIIKGSWTHQLANFATEVTKNKNIEFALTRMENMPDTPTVEEAMKWPDWLLFKIVTNTKIEAIERMGTFRNGSIPQPC